MPKSVIAVICAALGALAATVAITSYDAIQAMAAGRAVSPHLAWTIPIAVDGLIVLASTIAWVEARNGRPPLFPVAVAAVALAVSGWANIAHAPESDPLSIVLAAVPPAALAVSVELIAWTIQRRRRDNVGGFASWWASLTPDTASEGATVVAADAQPTANEARETLDERQEPIGDIAATLAELRLEGVDISARGVQAEVVRRCGWSSATVSKHWQAAVDYDARVLAERAAALADE